jgi:hypothetical protein
VCSTTKLNNLFSKYICDKIKTTGFAIRVYSSWWVGMQINYLLLVYTKWHWFPFCILNLSSLAACYSYTFLTTSLSSYFWIIIGRPIYSLNNCLLSSFVKYTSVCVGVWECPVILFIKFPWTRICRITGVQLKITQRPQQKLSKQKQKYTQQHPSASEAEGILRFPAAFTPWGLHTTLYMQLYYFLRIGKRIHKKRVGCGWRNSQFCSRCYYNSNNQSSIWNINTLGLLKFRKYNPHICRALTHSHSLARS